MYGRIFFQVAQANEFLRQSTDDVLQVRGKFLRSVIDDIPQWRAEARFLRALSYWHGIDLFGNIPLVDESFPRGSRPAGDAAEVFEFIETELLAITEGDENRKFYRTPDSPNTDACRQSGGVDGAREAVPECRGVSSTARGVALGRRDDYTTRILDAGYTLDPDYHELFLADNDRPADEFIFAIPHDGHEDAALWGHHVPRERTAAGSTPPTPLG